MKNHDSSGLAPVFAIAAMLAFLAGASPTQAQDADRIKPATPSSFVSTLGGRNPFWPVGWKPKEKAPVAVTEERPAITNIPPEAASISSILLGDPPIAVINGGEFTTGDIVPLVVNGTPIKARLIAVGDGFIRLRFDGRDFIVRRER